MSRPPTVEIIAHRGASRDRLENTLQAFRTALEQSADAFELDVHATRDGVVVVHHDPTVKPREGGSEQVISRLTFNELSALTLANGETVPTLDEVLELAANRATVYVEVKGSAIERLVVECLHRHPHTPTAVHSFDHRIPQTIGTIDSNIARGILSSSYVLDLPHMLRAAGARDLWQHHALVDQALIESAHREGARVVVWTENSVEHAAHLVQMGIDAICTDIPGVMRTGLAAKGLVSPVAAYRSPEA